MSVKVYCFDWAVYAERIMPAFARWLLDSDESSVYNLFAKTRCAQEEQFLPDPMKRCAFGHAPKPLSMLYHVGHIVARNMRNCVRQSNSPPLVTATCITTRPISIKTLPPYVRCGEQCLKSTASPIPNHGQRRRDRWHGLRNSRRCGGHSR